MQPGTAFHPLSFTPAASHVMPIGWMGPPNALYGIQEKGYIDSELFLKWLHHFIKYAPEERPLILIMDQHETHVSKDVIMFCRENKVEILCLPAHTTHILQPLDIAVFNPLKTAFSIMASRMGLVRGDIVVGKKQFSAILKCVPHCCHSSKHKGWVPQSWHLYSVQGCCGHNPGHFDINTMIIHPLSYMHYFSSVLMCFTCVLFS